MGKSMFMIYFVQIHQKLTAYLHHISQIYGLFMEKILIISIISTIATKICRNGGKRKGEET